MFSTEVVAGLNRLLLDVLRTEEEDPDGVLFIRTFLSRYTSRGRPLSGYFIVCCVIEAQWTILAQALTPVLADREKRVPDFVEAAAANMAWKTLLHEPIDVTAKTAKGSEAYQRLLQTTIESSMKCFTNLLVQIEGLDAEPSEDSYAWETMSESLVCNSVFGQVIPGIQLSLQKIACVCSAASGTLDKALFARIQLLLSEESPVSDILVQEAALKSTAILVRK